MAHSDVHKAMVDVQVAEAADKAEVFNTFAGGMQPGGESSQATKQMPDIGSSDTWAIQNIVA